MRKFLLILACAFSICVHAETNIVQVITPQWYNILQLLSEFRSFLFGHYGYDWIQSSNSGSITADEGQTDFFDHLLVSQDNQKAIAEFLHLLWTGNLEDSYNTSDNNILAYASSLHNHNEDVRELLSNIQSNLYSVAYTVGGFPLHYIRQYDITRAFHSDYTNNFERLYDAITNIDFKVSISNQIDLLQVMNGNLLNNFNGTSNFLDKIFKELRDIRFENEHLQFGFEEIISGYHTELMDFLHSLSNSALFASNLCNCCGGSNSNYQDSVIAMLDWMTNNFPDVAESPIGGGGGGSNSVWAIWRPSGVPSSGWFHLFVPAVEWVQSGEDAQQYKPRYGDYQYDSVYNAVWEEYNDLLQNYRANGIDGQQFLAGLVDLQLHIMANMSTQLYMIDSKLPSKTNLWDWIESYKRTISDEVTQAEQENSEIVSSVSYLLDYTPFGIVGGHFPKVSSALNSLRLEQGASPVLRIPIPSVLRVSDSDALVVDVRESDWFTTGRTWCRWIFTFIWGWLFIRLGIVPIFYVFFFTVRVAEISAHLVFMGSVRGSSGIVSSFGAAAVDMVLSLIGIDTDFKKFVWGIMRD